MQSTSNTFVRSMAICGCACLMMLSVTANSQSNQCGANVPPQSRSFKNGEELKIVVSYNWFLIWTDVVDVWLKVSDTKKNGLNLINVRGYGMSRPFYDWFYQVRDVYETWLDPVTLRPKYFNRDINEDGYLLKNFYVFDFPNEQIVATIQKKKNPPTVDTIKVSYCTNDVISLIYNMRNMDFSAMKKGKTFPIEVAVDSKVHTVMIKYDGKETIKVRGLGYFRTIRLSAKMMKNRAFTGKENMIIWLTDDQNHLPIYMESPIKIGTVKARITEMKNLKYPLTSKVN